MRVSLESQFCLGACARDHPSKSSHSERRAAAVTVPIAFGRLSQALHFVVG
jgi:hypothetical protein